MSDGICVDAPAKINLGLRVLPKRDDGFHGIESIFVSTGLCDSLTVSVRDGLNVCNISCAEYVLPERNTISAAYESCRIILKKNLPALNVRLKKRIPAGGGLGGGSSDAAAFVLAMQRCGIAITDDVAYKIAAAVGSDVFYFLKTACAPKAAALVWGRGEEVLPFSPRNDLHYVLLFPGVHSSTSEAYSFVDERMEEDGHEYLSLDALEKNYRKPVGSWRFVNSFTQAISDRYPIIKDALSDVKKSGALFCDMSGSGSTVFGVYDSAESAAYAGSFLSGRWNISIL